MMESNRIIAECKSDVMCVKNGLKNRKQKKKTEKKELEIYFIKEVIIELN